jgi:hypothetical protein
MLNLIRSAQFLTGPTIMDNGAPAAPLTLPIVAAKPDHAMLVAGVAVRQAGTYTATLAERMRLPQARGDMRGALVAMFVAGDEREAAALRGSFHPRVALTRGEESRDRGTRQSS